MIKYKRNKKDNILVTDALIENSLTIKVFLQFYMRVKIITYTQKLNITANKLHCENIC